MIDTQRKILLSDPNLPQSNELPLDLNLVSPISHALRMGKAGHASAELLLDYLAKQPMNAYNQELLMMSLKDIAESEPIGSFIQFAIAGDSTSE